MKAFDTWRRNSPFYNESHEEFSMNFRKFFQQEATPNVEAWEEAGIIPREFHRKAGDVGIFALGHPEQYGGLSEGIDFFHRLVLVEEMALTGAGGIGAGLLTAFVALPPIIEKGPQALRDRIVPEIISGEKIIAIAVTEPSGGSDVAQLKTRAVREGDHYLVNGSKTFITNGMRADYVMTAVRTDNGISMLLIETDSEGFDRTSLKKMGWHSSDTATLYFDNLKVSVENLIGEEGKGFKYVLKNFNSERLQAAHQCTSFARVCHAEAVEWANQRNTFGKLLGEHQAIRTKLADMARQINATQAWIDLCAWQHEQGTVTASDCALLKVQATLMFEKVAREAAQVLGGASYIEGSNIERIYREVRVVAIGGGSEEILLDMAGRQLGYGLQGSGP
jgi:acyl-CoA dehydrogenase